MKPKSIGAILLPVTTLQRKQYRVEWRNESAWLIIRNFEAFPSGGLNRSACNKKNRIFSYFWRYIFVHFGKKIADEKLDRLHMRNLMLGDSACAYL